MRSHAHFKSHPLHPMLVAFPIGLLVGGMVADLVGRIGGWESLWVFGGWGSMTGVGMGLVAGVPGFIDYLYAVPPGSSGKTRATRHMVVNVSALVLVAIGWAFRDWRTFEPGWGAVILEIVAVGLMSVGGWLGGTLVYRNQIAVDHRYAGAGKWHEVTVSGGPAVRIEGAEAMKAGQMWLVRWGEKRVVLGRVEGGYVAFEDRCSHKGGALCDGALVGGVVQCPWHGSQFDVRSGEVRAGPAEVGIGVYRVEEREGGVWVGEAKGGGMDDE